MALRLAEIYTSDKPTKNNKDLFDYLNRNLETAVMNGGIKFKFCVTDQSGLNELRDKGITRLPAMRLSNKNTIGVPAIISVLRDAVKTNKKPAAPKSEEEVLSDYFKSQIGDIKKDADGKFILPEEKEESEFDPPDRTRDIQKALEQREAAGGKKKQASREAPPKPSRAHIPDNNTKNRQDRQDRQDNVREPPITVPKARGGEDAQDDIMMQQLLAKMSQD
jgi:hypothetical protein